MVIIAPQFMYAMNHAYFTLILVHGLSFNYGFEINHLCEIGLYLLHNRACSPNAFYINTYHKNSTSLKGLIVQLDYFVLCDMSVS